MKLSTRARYGLRALLDLALHQGEGLVQLKWIALRQQISLPYLEHLIRPLVAGGLVKSVRGARGGVTLYKPASEIRLREVIRLLEGPTGLVECVDNPATCERSAVCVVRDVWSAMEEAMVGVLDSMTLQDLVQREETKRQAAMETYCI